jgi:hypothetical protein
MVGVVGLMHLVLKRFLAYVWSGQCCTTSKNGRLKLEMKHSQSFGVLELKVKCFL